MKNHWHSNNKQRQAAYKYGYRSGLELKVADQIKEAKYPVNYETETLQYIVPQKNSKYTPDFIFTRKDGKTMYIETKGRWTSTDRQKMKNILASNPDIDLRIIFQNPNQKISKGSKTTYEAYALNIGIKHVAKKVLARALDYMGLTEGMPIQDIRPDAVFIGSCTNSRIEDLRDAAAVLNGKRIAPSVRKALVVPGSGLVKAQAELEGLDKIFLDAGMEWREPGCSMCLAMNADRLLPGERCASTSNRNFEGRQGSGGRTHLVSPAMAAAAAIAGHFVPVAASADGGGEEALA